MAPERTENAHVVAGATEGENLRSMKAVPALSMVVLSFDPRRTKNTLEATAGLGGVFWTTLKEI